MLVKPFITAMKLFINNPENTRKMSKPNRKKLVLINIKCLETLGSLFYVVEGKFSSNSSTVLMEGAKLNH